MMVWKMILLIFLFQGCILRFHVNLPGCISFIKKIIFILLSSIISCKLVMLKRGLDVDFIGNFFSGFLISPTSAVFFFFLFVMLSAVVVFTVSAFHPRDPLSSRP